MRELTVRERRAEYDEMDFGRYFQHDRTDEAFQKLADSISYLGGRDEVLEAGIRILREHTSDAEIRKMALRR
jgi:hypothetical protein